ncbi:MarC family protein [Portibacter marinus]|uniref:MarC family protein n=1 Tax=Portibacter marinus TaxID=2898660 RepID=UPI001F363BB2|nr:MarC family protein [Portibacter marinus]
MEPTFSIISTALVLTFILDPFGNVPLLLTILKDIDRKHHRRIIIREMIIGLIILVLFLFAGRSFLNIFHLETSSVSIAGGLIFLIIALRLIFPAPDGSSIFSSTGGEPFIVPIAMPMVAGPSALATLMVMANNHEGHLSGLFFAVLIAWGATAIILLLSPLFFRLLRKKGLVALEKLMGMLLLIMAVQMLLNGISEYAHTLMATFEN